MRGVAELAGASPQQASLVLRRLIELGVVERRDVPPVALVRLVRENLAAQAVVAVARDCARAPSSVFARLPLRSCPRQRALSSSAPSLEGKPARRATWTCWPSGLQR